jgi:hypothetical protein
MPNVSAYPTDWSTNSVLTESALEGNFNHIRTAVNSYALWTDVASQSVSVTITFGVSQTFSAGIALTGSLTMATAASKIVPGATSFSIRDTADAADNLIIVDAGTATFRNTVVCTTLTATSIGGTLTTAAQANVTSLGSLTALTIAGNLTFSGASRLIIPGSTALTIRNVGDTANAVAVAAAAVTLGGTAVNVVLGAAAPATNATVGYPFMGSTSGTPTGVVTAGAFVLDAGANKLWVSYGAGTWKAATLA